MIEKLRGLDFPVHGTDIHLIYHYKLRYHLNERKDVHHHSGSIFNGPYIKYTKTPLATTRNENFTHKFL